jgi:serine/threonine-protein kinase
MPEITSRLSTALADRYKIEKRLGEGGMATVYLAEDLKHKRKVAVKVLRPELSWLSTLHSTVEVTSRLHEEIQ